MQTFFTVFFILLISPGAFARSFYEVLSVDSSATEQTIRKQFRDLAAVNHPDRFADAGAKKRQTQILTELNTAKDVLLNYERRYYYDLISSHGARHGAWVAFPRNHDLESLKTSFGPVPPPSRKTADTLSDQLADPTFLRKFIRRNLANNGASIEDIETQRAVLKALRTSANDDLAELVAAKFVITDPGVATEIVELKKTAIGIALTEQAIKHRTTNRLFHITQNEAIDYLHARTNERDEEVVRRARQAINKLGLPPSPLYSIQHYLQRVQRCYGSY